MEEIWEKGRNALVETLGLAKEGQTERAFNLLDDVLSDAIHENRATSILLLCQHGAVIAHAGKDRARQIRYTEMALPYRPDYRFAAYNLALLLLADGQTVRAERYAIDAYKLSIASETVDDRNLVAAILLQWPMAAEDQ